MPIVRFVATNLVGAGDPAETMLAIFREFVERLRLLEVPYLEGDKGDLPCGLLRGESIVLLRRSGGVAGLWTLRLLRRFILATGIWEGEIPDPALMVSFVRTEVDGDSSMDCSWTGDMKAWRIMAAGGVDKLALDCDFVIRTAGLGFAISSCSDKVLSSFSARSSFVRKNAVSRV